MWAKKIGLIVMVTLLWQLQWTPGLWAQAAAPTLPTDCTSFPTCRIYLPTTATPSQPTLIANGQPLSTAHYTVDEEAVGVAVAFAFHEYTNPIPPSVRNPGATGEPRYIEFRKSVVDFIEHAEEKQWEESTYWLAAYRSGDTAAAGAPVGDFPALAAWETGLRRNEVYNKVNDYTTAETKNTPIVPLYDLIDHTIDGFTGLGAPATRAAKAIVVFTNGLLDGSSIDNAVAAANNTVTLDALLAHAADSGVTIHVVLLVSPQGELETTLRGNAEAIATPTGGQVVWLGETPDANGDVYGALTPLWDQIGQSRLQQVLAVDLLGVAETGIAPTDITVVLDTSDIGGAVPDLPIFQAPQLLTGTVAPATWTGTEPIAVRVAPTWADGYDDLARLSAVQYAIWDEAGDVVVEYVAQGTSLTATTIPTDVLSPLIDGSYRVTLLLTDKLLPSTPISATVGTFTVTLPAPEPPVTTAEIAVTDTITATPPLSVTAITALTTGGGSTVTGNLTPVPTTVPLFSFADINTIVGQIQSSVGMLLWPVVGLLALLLLFGGWQRWRDRQRHVDVIRTSDPPDEHTLPDEHTEPDIEGFPVARLIHEMGDGNLLPEILLYPSHESETQWTVGRSFQERDCYINHQRVSRYHAVLLERGSRYFIRHEGSSGGTYVNHVSLAARVEEQLQDGDLIHFSTAVAYRFKIEAMQPQGSVTEPETTDAQPGGTTTEPEQG